MKKILVLAVLTAISMPVIGASIPKTIKQPRKEFTTQPNWGEIQNAMYDFDLYLIGQGVSKPLSDFEALPVKKRREYVFLWLFHYIGDPRPEKGHLTKPENKKKFRAAYEMLKRFSNPAKLSDPNYEEAMAPLIEAEVYIGLYNPEIRQWFEQLTNNWVQASLTKKIARPAKKLARKPAAKKKAPAKKERKLVPKAKEKRVVIREAAKAFEAGIRVPAPGARVKAKIKRGSAKKPIKSVKKVSKYKSKKTVKKRVTSKRPISKKRKSRR